MPGRSRVQLPVCPAAELPPGSSRLVRTDEGRSIAVFNVNGTYYALGTLCPHQGGPLQASKATGTTRTRVTPDGFEAEWVREGEIVRCGWHLYEFEIATGRALVDPGLRVATYPVYVVPESGGAEGADSGVVVVEA